MTAAVRGGPSCRSTFLYFLIASQKFLPQLSRALLSAYLTYLDGYFLFVRRLSFQSNELRGHFPTRKCPLLVRPILLGKVRLSFRF